MPTVETEKMMRNIVFHIGLVVDMVNLKTPLNFEETFLDRVLILNRNSGTD